MPVTKIDKVKEMLTVFLASRRTTYRQFDSLVGKINAMGIVLGDITRLMLRFSHMAIVRRAYWDSHFYLDASVCCELKFWLDNLSPLNARFLDSVPSFTRVAVAIVKKGSSGVRPRH